MFRTYRSVLQTPGSLAFSSAGLVGRVPASMTGLGIVLLIETTMDSFTRAGLVAAVYILTSAVAAPMQGRIADTFGQTRVLIFAPILYTIGIAFLLHGALNSLTIALVGAVVAGTGAPQTGNMVRTRWTHSLEDKELLGTAFAWEAILDEVVFIIGPVLVTFLTLNVDPRLGLVAAAVSALAGAWLLAALQSTTPEPTRRREIEKDPLNGFLLGMLIIAGIGVGVVFGSSEVLIVAFTDELHEKHLAGWVLAVSSIGSLLAGFVVGARPMAGEPLTHLRIYTLALTVALIPLPFLTTTGQLTIGMFVMGLTVAPTLITAVKLVERVTPLTRLTEALTWVSTGLAGGVALGAAASGRVVDVASASAGFYVVIIAAFSSMIVAMLTPISQTLDRSKNI